MFDLIEIAGASLGARAWKAGANWAVLSASHEDIENKRLTREIQTFRELGDGNYSRRTEVHHVRLFDRRSVTSWLAQAGFEVQLATAYGSFLLPPGRVAFYASRR